MNIHGRLVVKGHKGSPTGVARSLSLAAPSLSLDIHVMATKKVHAGRYVSEHVEMDLHMINTSSIMVILMCMRMCALVSVHARRPSCASYSDHFDVHPYVS